jgi:phosphomannomutase/phosphoglucomutase
MRRIFGTFGVRGIYPEELDEEFALKMGKAFGTFLSEENEKPTVVVGRDTRRSGEGIFEAFISGVLSTGADVLDVGILPTPLVQFAARMLKVNGGAVITASHNPPEYNGIKLLEGNGMGLARSKEAKVEDIFLSEKFKKTLWMKVGQRRKHEVKGRYFNEVFRRIDVEAIRRRNPVVMVDEAGGAGALILPELLEVVGCKVISLNAHISGFFSARHPEPNEGNLSEFSKMVKVIKPDIAVAQDGDADRAVFLTEDGGFIHGDKTFALVEKYTLMKKKGSVVTTVATSDVIDYIANEYGVKVYRTKVGDLVVTGKLLEVGGVIGGEENGGVIFPDLVLGRDGIFTTVKIAEIISTTGKSFPHLLNELPKTYQFKTKVRFEGDRKQAVKKFAEIMKKRGYKVDETDGAKVITEDGWVLVRASGTEPIIRIFSESTIEGKEKEYYEIALRTLESLRERED